MVLRDDHDVVEVELVEHGKSFSRFPGTASKMHGAGGIERVVGCCEIDVDVGDDGSAATGSSEAVDAVSRIGERCLGARSDPAIVVSRESPGPSFASATFRSARPSAKRR